MGPPRRGELIQIDGCDHEWFEDRGLRCTALVFVDDATSALMELLFCESEPAFSDFTATREYLEQHGRPVALYSDKAGVFHVNAKEARGGDGVTQFARAMHSLNIDIICANTPTAKGRVERAHLTLQDRLVKALRLRGISEIASANAFAEEYRADYNRRFARAARSEHDAELQADPVPARRDRRGPRCAGPARRRRGARGWRHFVLVRGAGAARHRLPQGARSSARRGRGEQETQRSSGVHEGPTEATRRRSSREDFDDPPRRQTASRRNTKEDNSTGRPMREDRTFLLWRKPDICTFRRHPPPTATRLRSVHCRDPVSGGALAAHLPLPRRVRQARLSRNVTPRRHDHAPAARPSRCGGGGRAAGSGTLLAPRRYRLADNPSRMTETSRNRPPQVGHFKTSISKTRRSNSAQTR